MKYEIPVTEVRPGDILLCDGSGFIFSVLSFLISIFDSGWRKLKRKPWHCRLVVSGYGRAAIVLEALAGGVVEKTIDSIPLSKQRAYRWFKEPINMDFLSTWVDAHLGKPYDVMAYFSTAAQYLLRAIWNRRIPRLLDDRYTCQELIMEFCEDAGKPMQSKRDCPMITDLCKSLGIILSRKGGYKLLSVLKERKTK
jgi:hypothetical protein